MSVYKPKGGRFFIYDFERGGRRFSGSTKRTERRAAERIEDVLIKQAEREAELARRIGAQGRREEPITMAIAAARYFEEVGKHHAAPKTTERDLNRAIDWFGTEKRLEAITDEEVSRWVAERRSERVKGRPNAPLVSNARVNRATIDLLRKLFARARKSWKLRFHAEPDWPAQRLRERGELVRELRADDEARLVVALPSGYRDLWRFALASGQRLRECFLDWSQVDEVAGTITITKKGGKLHVFPISREMRAILSAQPGNRVGPVFWYVCRRASIKHRSGRQYPVTYEGMKTVWRRTAKRLNIALRFHDMRHTAATRLLRRSGNLKFAQQLLGHADIKTTAKFYAHVTFEDLRRALDAESPMESPMIGHLGPRKA